VGHWVNGGTNVTLAERWDGSGWTLEPTPNPAGASSSVLEDASCRLDTCLAVGWSYYSGAYRTLGVIREPTGEAPDVTTKPAFSSTRTSATLGGSITPNGLFTTYQFEYGTTIGYGSKAPAAPKSIGAGANPVEVSEKIEGLQPGTTYHFRLVASNAEGTTASTDQTFTTPTWEIQSTPNPGGADASHLFDVSCEPSSTNLCTAVGLSTSSGADSPLAQRWNGSSWSEQTPAKKSGATHTRLFGVDCPSATRCIAAGNYQASEGSATLAELWNENKWSIQSTPVPSEATSSELAAVGCNNTAECMAAGSAVVKGVKTAIVEEWNSPTWTLSTVPIPSGATSSQLDGVDCIWSGFCVAVGRYTSNGGAIKSLAMFWNGTSWSLQTLTDPAGAAESELFDISCTTSPNACTAVGSWENSANDQFTLAYRFNGSSWTLQSTPNPSGSTASIFLGVSCASATSCTAVGTWVNDSSGSFDTLAEKWDGTSWSVQGTPNPSGAIASILYGASCRGISCIGVGWSADASGGETTLAEIR